MRIGVFLENLAAELGGGFVIQDDIFAAFLELADSSRHSFVVFGGESQSEESRRSPGRVEYRSYLAPFSSRAVDALRRRLPRRRGTVPASRLEQLARSEEVDLVWFVGNQGVPIDLPYFSIVLDLQHRVQPWFPEVSHGGVWAHRERFHAEFLRRAARVIVGTEVGREEVERFYGVPRENIRLLPHPVPRIDAEAPRPPVLELHGLEAGYLFYPAQLWPHKNHATLLLALAQLKDEAGHCPHLVLTGSDKGNGGHLRDMVRSLRLEHRVHFLGFVPREQLIELYRHALALVYPSLFGPENLPPLEAFALGCPVIAADVPGAREQLGDAAILVDALRPEEIAAAVRRLLDDSELGPTLVARGRARAARWTARDFVNGVLEMIDEFDALRRCWGDWRPDDGR
jgi:glycosyltransferase involved in cell wall biosynthesis